MQDCVCIFNTTEMKKIYNKLTVLALILSMCSCAYDYDMPDYSNARPQYKINSISDDVRSVWIRDAVTYGLSFEVAQERWQTIVEELDADGNILYSGNSRGQADKKARELKVGFICQQRVSTIDNNYYDICTFWMEKKYRLEISPFVCDVIVNSSDKYSIIEADETRQPCPYNLTWNSSVTLLMINTAESLGYEVSGTELQVVERDREGNVAYCGSPAKNSTTDYISHTGAYSIDVLIDFYGWPQGKYKDKIKVGTITFPSISLSPNIDIVLTADTEHTIEKYV